MRGVSITAALLSLTLASCGNVETQQPSTSAEMGVASQSVGTEPAFPFATSTASIDLAEPGSGEKFQKLVSDAAQSRLVYISWEIRNADKTSMFSSLSDRCSEIDFDRKKPLTIWGRPDDADNHFVMSMTVAAEATDPYSDVWCFFGGGYPIIHIRGFFYGYVREIPTAFDHVFRSVPVESSQIPKGFLKREEP